MSKETSPDDIEPSKNDARTTEHTSPSSSEDKVSPDSHLTTVPKKQEETRVCSDIVDKKPESINSSLGTTQRISKKSESTTSLVELKKEFGFWNGVGLCVGSMIGSGIFVSPGSVVRYTGSVGMALVVWVVSGFMSILGALCFTELGTMIPKNGGRYTYVLEAFGPVPAFLLLWVSNIITLPAGRAVVLITFANYLLQPFFPDCSTTPYWGVRLIALALLGLAAYINSAGVKFGTRLQDSLTLMKVFALIVIIVVGIHQLALGHTENYLDPMKGTIYEPASIATAFYSTLFAYGGWDSCNFIMDELKDPYKNLPRAIAISLTIVTIVYTLTNMAYFVVLSPNEVLSSSAVAVTFGNRTLGVIAWIISIFVACSTYGALNGGIIAHSRLTYAGAKEGHLPKCLTLIHVHNNTPVTAIVSVVIIPAFVIFMPDIGSILAYTTFTGSITDLMCVGALLWLRYKEPDRPRHIKIWLGFPILYLILSIFVAIFPVVERPVEIGVGVFVFLLGLVVYYFTIHLKIKFIGDAMDKVTYVCQILFQSVEEEKED